MFLRPNDSRGFQGGNKGPISWHLPNPRLLGSVRISRRCVEISLPVVSGAEGNQAADQDKYGTTFRRSVRGVLRSRGVAGKQVLERSQQRSLMPLAMELFDRYRRGTPSRRAIRQHARPGDGSECFPPVLPPQDQVE